MKGEESINIMVCIFLYALCLVFEFEGPTGKSTNSYQLL